MTDSNADSGSVPARSRYRREAYVFVSQALDYTLKSIGERRHVTGPELLEGVREFAIKQFGYLTKTVFESWGIRRTDDFGQIVFELIARGNMTKTATDDIVDFHNVYDFRDAFDDFDALDFSLGEEAEATE